MHPWEDWQDVLPPTALLPARALDEGHAVRGSDGEGELIARDVLCSGHLQDTVHVYHSLGDGGRLRNETQRYCADIFNTKKTWT